MVTIGNTMQAPKMREGFNREPTVQSRTEEIVIDAHGHYLDSQLNSASSQLDISAIEIVSSS
jgi:hypothetical protein